MTREWTTHSGNVVDGGLVRLVVNTGSHADHRTVVAASLRDHLNATGWEPPKPRRTAGEAIATVVNPLPAASVIAALEVEGYRIVDVRALADDIAFYYGKARTPEFGRIFDALEAPHGA